uniref:Zinc finger protein 830 n=1 Tax=Timema californicum TaxID=61474 RepID=A0A7R9P5Y5_TIMCA|nr:unnamed protein product [Timema californicum]
MFILALSRRGQERMRAYHIPRRGILGSDQQLRKTCDYHVNLRPKVVHIQVHTTSKPMIFEYPRYQRLYRFLNSFLTYTSNGQLTCVLCESEVRSEAVWSVHINGKQHRDNIARVKRRKEELAKQEFLTTAKPTLSLGVKRSAAPREIQAPPKKIKSILKNANEPPRVPVGFFDVMNGPTAANITKNITIEPVASAIEQKDSVTDVSTLVEPLGGNSEESEDSESEEVSENGAKGLKIKNANPEEPLPEGFFDDPMLDAKARHVEYKDPIQEEWDKFQREMKEEVTMSAQIIAEDQEEATAERQIDEIDEQIRNWNRVLDLERKKEEVTQAGCTRSGSLDDADDVSSPDEADFDEYLDWRAKKSYK